MNRRKNSLDNTTAVTATTASSTLEELESLSLRGKDATAATPATSSSSRRRSSSHHQQRRPSIRRLSSQELRDKMTPPNSQEFRVLKKSRNTDQDDGAVDAMSFSEEGEDLFAAEHVPRTPRSKSRPKVSLQQQQQPNWDPFASTPQSLDSGSGHRAKQLLEDVHRVLKQSLRIGGGGSSDPNNNSSNSNNKKSSSSSKKSKKSSSNNGNSNSMDKHLRKEKLQKRRNSIDTASISDDHTRASNATKNISSVRGGGKTQRRRNSLFGGLTHLQQPQDDEPPALEPMTTPHAPSKPKIKRTSPSSPKTSTTRTRSPPKRTSSSRQLHTQAAQPIFTTLARKHHGLLATSTGTGTSNSTANRRGSLDSATASSSNAMTPASQVLEKVRALRRSKSRNESADAALDSSNASSTKSSSPSETAALTQLDESQTSKLEQANAAVEQTDITMDDSVIRKSSKTSRRKSSSKDSSGSRRRSLSAQDTELGLSEHAAQLQRQLGKSKSSRRVLHRNKSMDSAVVVEEEAEQQQQVESNAAAAPSGNRALWLQQSKQPLAVGTSSRTLSTPAAAAPGRSFRRSKSVRLVPETSATGATKKLTMEPVSLDRSLSCRKLRSNNSTTAHVVPVEHHNSNSTALTMSTTSCSSASESNDSHADLVVGGGRFLRRRSSSMASSSHSQQHQQQQAQVQPQPQAPQPLMRRSSSVEFSLSASQHAAQEQQEQQQQSRRASLQSSSTSTPEAPTQMPRRVSMARARSSRRLVTRKDAKGVRQKMENGWDDFVSARNVVVS